MEVVQDRGVHFNPELLGQSETNIPQVGVQGKRYEDVQDRQTAKEPREKEAIQREGL